VTDKRIISTCEYFAQIESLATRIKSTGIKYNFIYGIPRSGLPIATFLSHMLGIPQLTYIKPTLIDKVNFYLIVDELVDTGTTFIKFAQQWNGRLRWNSGCLYYKNHSRYTPTFVSESSVVSCDTWLVFPYEAHNVDPQLESQKHLRKSMKCIIDNKLTIE
jgi:hypoxanthine phosphoribosyltransferase